MSKYDFIFSNHSSHRLARHLVFWSIFLIYFFYTNLFPSKPAELWAAKTFRNAFELMIYFPLSVVSVYIGIYLLLPRYILTGKYVRLGFLITGLSFVYFLLAFLLTVVLAALTRDVPFGQLPITFTLFQPIRYGIGLPLTSTVLTIIIKLFKFWHQKQTENELLQRQKIDTELQLLKTQFQPHFLYDSLQRIYYLIRERSPQSPETVLRLSDLLSYVLYENEKDYVPLDRELHILRTYLSLKKLFYPDRLWIQLTVEGEDKKMSIEPLLLVTIIEHCFEEFLREPQQELALNLDIRIKNGELNFLLKCTGNETKQNIEVKDPDWKKLSKRIELLYPARHSIDIYSENGTTSFLLILEARQESAVVKKEKDELLHYEHA